MAKRILVTGGNTGIGLALCRQLAVDHNCHVFMGSRSLERGEAGIKAIVDAHPEAADSVQLIQIDVANDVSVAAAASMLAAKGVVLSALVNNAGVGFRTGGDADALMQTNLYGPKRVSEAMLPLIDPKEGRIVNVSSGAASMWLRNQSPDTKALFSAPESWEQLDAAIKSSTEYGVYGMSKAALCAYTMLQARQYPNLLCTSLTPGFIETNMTQGFGAKLTPEQGTVSLQKCLFGEVGSGFYYGSDGLRSPLTVTRDPGTPEYEGEPEPDAKRYIR